MQKISLQYLKESGKFKLVKELRFNEILGFVLENIKAANSVTISFFVINALFLCLLVSQIILGILKHGISFDTFSNYSPAFLWGVVTGSLLIIPVHEGLHALGFLIVGARKIRFGADLKQMIVYATAENFVASKKSFFLLALAPFVVINIVCIPFLVFGGSETRFFLTTMLFLHNIMCVGDFGMMSFFIRHKDKEMFTFDDLDTKTTWFYEKEKS